MCPKPNLINPENLFDCEEPEMEVIFEGQEDMFDEDIDNDKRFKNASRKRSWCQ